ncbi:beta-galactosidase [Parasphingorhabdus sp. DH2-15]|uniref:beta-galactosidase n=1 Tax=Parasphingorhabdus sp. DH2-15 TaxID=3444112 RepID=UPI003F688F00
MKLGCCYYPEHWPETLWTGDAAQMADLGLSLVRIGEFAWSRIEPEPGRYDWAWLDRAVETLRNAGLQIIMGTPTATPPKWLVDSMPDMLAIDLDGKPRKFGSRRHYCFSHKGYRAECARIVAAMAERYGEHPAIAAWQTDNEYGCHDTVLSISDAAAEGFRQWLADRYTTIAALNTAWGNVFWSMEYRDFAEIDPPFLTVTEAHPAHVLDYRRFASDEVAAFNALQVDIIRSASPGRDVLHNFMGFYNDFDHHKLSKDLDLATWDSYPLGFLEQFWFSDEEKAAYTRQGHPDIAAYHHDLYRGMCSGANARRWGVMEQQPGPVNWAKWNPAPLPGMVRLWSWEAAAHGAEFCSYFRWRQVPFAQEQMHAGLLRPDSQPAPGFDEVQQIAQELDNIDLRDNAQASVALIFSYDADWMVRTQPQGADFRYDELTFRWYSALRQLGLDVDIVSTQAPLDGYKLIVAPTLPHMDAQLIERLKELDATILFGPRTGSKSENLSIPDQHGLAFMDLHVERVESLRPGLKEGLPNSDLTVERWMEDAGNGLESNYTLADGRNLLIRQLNFHYCAGWPDNDLLRVIMRDMAVMAGLKVYDLPSALRISQRSGKIFAFNYGTEALDLSATFPQLMGTDLLIGNIILPPAGVAIWKAERDS